MSHLSSTSVSTLYTNTSEHMDIMSYTQTLTSKMHRIP